MGGKSRAAMVWKLLRNPKSVTLDRLRDTHSFQLETPWTQSQPQKKTGGRQKTQSFNGPFIGKAFPINVLIGVQVLGHSVVSCQHQEALQYWPSLQSAPCVLS